MLQLIKTYFLLFLGFNPVNDLPFPVLNGEDDIPSPIEDEIPGEDAEMRMPDQPAQEDESEPKSVSHEALEDEVNKGIEIAMSFADDSTPPDIIPTESVDAS
jgi:hypothetical protein